MLDINLAITKKFLKKKHFQVVNISKKFLEATTIIKYILNLGIYFIINLLLAFVLVAENQLIRKIFKNDISQFENNFQSLFKAFKANATYFLYFESLTKVNVYLKNGFTIIALLNINKKFFIITKNLIKGVNLAIKQKSK